MDIGFKEFFLKQQGIDVDKYKTCGFFGEGCLEDAFQNLVSEGLVKSYPKEKVVGFLKKYRDEKSIDLDIDPDSYNTLIKLVTTSDGYEEIDPDSLTTELNKVLKVYGWFVGRTSTWGENHTFMIEPRVPENVLEYDPEDGGIYHITNELFYKKIQKNGLNPRETTTPFTHPANRIYLLLAEGVDEIDYIKSMLSQAKRHHTRNDEWQDDRWSEDNMLILKIDLPPHTLLYEDPMFPPSDGYTPVFTTKSIAPHLITRVE